MVSLVKEHGTIANTYSISEIIGSGYNLEGIGYTSNIRNSYFAAEHAKISDAELKGTYTTIKWLTSKENLEERGAKIFSFGFS